MCIRDSINRACADGSLAANPVLNEAFAAAARPGAALHLMGLVYDGGVHSSNAVSYTHLSRLTLPTA